MSDEGILLSETDNHLEKSIETSEQTVSVATELLENMKKASETLRKNQQSIQEMEDKMNEDNRQLDIQLRRKYCNIIFAVVLGVGFICIGIVAIVKFYYKVSFI